ncbi:PREDICTED: protein phosphatase 2C 70-like isoform X2 [Tarenaya hassleriana]|uniref:protein phosphatase 2C 70-like isoform X2 n=1 Tax=Tarenaya hassleriana TaxID=28532 RepID=UPI00053C7A02|nr:PREDICTED: protein phosphatase 2C 70-like isoform X2 [Tarenaya hassleriana]
MGISGIFMVLMLLLISFLILSACKPWRYLSRFRSFRLSVIKAGDLQRPLVSDHGNSSQGQTNELTREYDLEGACYKNEGLLHASLTEGCVYKQRLPSSSPHLTLGESLIVEVISEHPEDVSVGQTLKHQAEKGQLAEVQNYDWQDNQSHKLKHDRESIRLRELSPKPIEDKRSWLFLEVISGPSVGLRFSVESTSINLPLTLGRVSPSGLLVKDFEVSGKHAQINWNSTKLKWELVDMGSLNGTLLNSRSVSHHNLGSRNWGDPIELASGDIITVGTTTKIYVRISSQNEYRTPFRVGVASDPMALRQGGRKLPMEDVCYYQWPLPGADKFGLFGVCDGHGGPEAAQVASKIFPEILANILSDPVKKGKVLSQCDASDILRDAFSKTEACLDHLYEGCTATVLLIWEDGEEKFFAQCANVGDSACVINVDGKYIQMTQDHRMTSPSERLRMQNLGLPLRDGEKRLFGVNLARVLGDKFLKKQDIRFSADPYISEPVRLDHGREVFALLASDGLWDVVSVKKAVQLVHENKMRDGRSSGEDRTVNQAEKIANSLLSEAKTMRTRDNTSVMYLDFDRNCKLYI